jgi:hypothetical protein
LATYVGRAPLEGSIAQQLASWWHEAEAAARSNRLPRTRRFLRWILACYPGDEEAWLWLARFASSQEARLAYLRQAYLFNRDSPRVQAALRQARSQQLESAVGDLKPGWALLRCLPDERILCGRTVPCQEKAGQRRPHAQGKAGTQRRVVA